MPGGGSRLGDCRGQRACDTSGDGILPPGDLRQHFFQTPALAGYWGEIDQLISLPALTGNGSLVVDSPEPRTGVAWKRTHAAPALTPTGRAKLVVSPEGTRPSGVERPSFLVTVMSMSSDDRFSILALV
jgi:hypothetical protein